MKVYLTDRKSIVKITIREFLSDLGHEVFVFDSELDLLTNGKTVADPPDLIIIGLDMSREKAIDAINSIHNEYPSVYIIITSDILPAENSVPNRIFAYLHRPIHLAELELLLTRLAEIIALEKKSNTETQPTGLKKIISGSI